MKNFEQEYIDLTNSEKYQKSYEWKTAIGLQAVDGLKPSDLLLELANKNIKGEITYNQVNTLLDNYYEEVESRNKVERIDEADKVSARIAQILGEKSFNFSVNEYMSIHRKLFDGIYSHAGKLRDYNISKSEWVLGGKSVIYGTASELLATLKYDFQTEMEFSYKGLNKEQIIHHLAVFTANLWQIHAFGEGNTRTLAVFLIKYLRLLGYEVTNDTFLENSWYFRNALVRANYNDFDHEIYSTTEYLELFLRNLLCDEKNELKNRYLHVNTNTDFEAKKENKVVQGFSNITTKQINQLKNRLSTRVFSRTDIENELGIARSRALDLIAVLLCSEQIEHVKGYGKGRYRFK